MTTTQVHPNPVVMDRWYKTIQHEKVPSSEHGRGLRWRARWIDDDGIYRAKSFEREVDAQRWIDEEICPISTAEIGGTVTVTTTKTGVFLYHEMREHEDFETTAQALLETVKVAACKYPGRPRHLYLDIHGHRNTAGGYDNDACEILGEFMQNFLGQYLTRFPTIGARLRNPNQCEDIPENLSIHTSSPEGGAMTVPTMEALIRPVLLAAVTPKTRGEIRDMVATAVNLSDEDSKVMLKNGRKTMFDDHASWAITFMNHSGLLERIENPGVQYGTQYVLTELGTTILAEHQHIDRPLLRQLGLWRQPRPSKQRPTSFGAVNDQLEPDYVDKYVAPVSSQPPPASLEAILVDALKAIRAIDGFKGGMERARETAHQALTDYEAARHRPSSNGKMSRKAGGGFISSGSR